MESDKKSFKKMFPNLSRELDLDENKISIDSFRTDPAVEELDSTDGFRNYMPTIIDFLRRCDNSTQAEEIISFLEKKGELTEESAKLFRERLKKEGVRSFGPKKEEDYYFKHGRLC
jgi:hypothetical protein